MRLAMIGLGRMGAGIGRRLMEHGHEIVAFDRSTDAVEAMAKDGATPAGSLEDVVAKMSAPRIFWVMLPAGEPTESTLPRPIGCGAMAAMPMRWRSTSSTAPAGRSGAARSTSPSQRPRGG
jgi:3-hydroxyisobutyrate dehydrogenase-like beta-hydroxyacid dehydrogenase